MTQVYDLSDPAHPVKIRDFGLPGQEPGSTGAVPTELHGPISLGPQGDRVYFGYGTDKGGFLQIVDREKLLTGPKEPTDDNLRFPGVSRMSMSAFNGAHTVFPMKGMPIADSPLIDPVACDRYKHSGSCPGQARRERTQPPSRLCSEKCQNNFAEPVPP